MAWMIRLQAPWSTLPLAELTRRNFAADARSGLLFGFFAGAFGPYIPVVALRLGADNLQVGLIISAPFFGFLLSTYWGHLSEGRPRVPWVFWPHLVARLLVLPLAWIKHTWIYVALVLAHNLVASMPMPAYSALMQRIYPAEYRGRLLAYIRVLLQCSMLPTVLLAGKLIDGFGPASVWPVAVILGVLSIFAFRGVQEPADVWQVGRSPYRPWQDASLLRNNPSFAWMQVGFMLFGFGNLMAIPLYSIFHVRHLGLSNAEIGFVSLAWSAAFFIGLPVWGTLIDRTRPLVASIAAAGLYLGGPLAIILLGNFPAALIAGFCLGLGDAAVDLSWLSHILAIGGSRTGTYTGLHFTLAGVRGIIAPLAGTALLALVPLPVAMAVATVTIALSLPVLYHADRLRT